MSLVIPTKNGNALATGTVNLIAGVGLGVAVTLNRASPTPVGTGYALIVQFVDANNVKTLSYQQSVSVTAGMQGFYTNQGSIYDANKNVFLMRGVNNIHSVVDGSTQTGQNSIAAKTMASVQCAR